MDKAKQKPFYTLITGSGAYDMIMFTALIELSLGKKVLIIDHSEDKELVECIPKAMNADVEYDLLSYKGFDYTSKYMEREEIKTEGYDHVFFYNGFNAIEDADQWIIMSSQQKRIQNKILNAISENRTLLQEQTTIILWLYDIGLRINNSHFYSQVEDILKPEPISLYVEHELDYQTLESRLKCERGDFVLREPAIVRDTVFSILKEIYPDITKKQFSTAYNCVKGGKYIDRIVLERLSRTS